MVIIVAVVKTSSSVPTFVFQFTFSISYEEDMVKNELHFINLIISGVFIPRKIYLLLVLNGNYLKRKTLIFH